MLEKMRLSEMEKKSIMLGGPRGDLLLVKIPRLGGRC